MKKSSEKVIKFLLIEDDDSHAKIISKTFERERIKNSLERVRDGEEALDFLMQRNKYKNSKLPDVILLDLKLPKIDGIEVLKEIKSNNVLSRIPIVVLTTSAAEKDKLAAYNNHVNSYLIKPADPENFRKLVKDLNLYWGILNESSNR